MPITQEEITITTEARASFLFLKIKTYRPKHRSFLNASIFHAFVELMKNKASLLLFTHLFFFNMLEEAFPLSDLSLNLVHLSQSHNAFTGLYIKFVVCLEDA